MGGWVGGVSETGNKTNISLSLSWDWVKSSWGWAWQLRNVQQEWGETIFLQVIKCLEKNDIKQVSENKYQKADMSCQVIGIKYHILSMR